MIFLIDIIIVSMHILLASAYLRFLSLIDAIRNNPFLSKIHLCRHSQCRHSQCRHSQYRNSQCRHSQWRHSQCRHSQCRHSQYRHSQCRHSQCRHSQCSPNGVCNVITIWSSCVNATAMLIFVCNPSTHPPPQKKNIKRIVESDKQFYQMRLPLTDVDWRCRACSSTSSSVYVSNSIVHTFQ